MGSQKPKIHFMVYSGQVVEVVDVGGGYLLPASTFIKRNNKVLYDNKNDAMYAKLVEDLGRGKPLTNYRTSKYYKYYIERLKKENPEYIV